MENWEIKIHHRKYKKVLTFVVCQHAETNAASSFSRFFVLINGFLLDYFQKNKKISAMV